MPDFSRDDRMPPLGQTSLPPASHTTAPRERRFSGPSDSAKSTRYPAVYQRPPPADYYRGPSPPPQPYRWAPAPPLDEPAYPPRAPHGAYHRDSWDYRYRDSHISTSGPPFSTSRTPPPFTEWGHMNPERGWSPGFGPEDTRYPRRGDWEDRENPQLYPHGWDRPPSPGPLPPRDWQHGPYDRPPAGRSGGSPSVLHEPGWREPPVSHYDRDLREEWLPPPPDDWVRDDHFIPDDPYLNDPPPPGPSYGPPRPRGRSFVQDRRMPQPSPSYNHPPPSQSSPRGPGRMPLDAPDRRHSQHDRRFSGGPGYSSDGRGFIPHGPSRRQYAPGRNSFNDPNHLQSRGAKLVPRDQLLVANTSIKVEDTDGHPLSASTPAPASASSASPEKGSFAGKRSRTDSVAAEAEPASRRPSPFASSAATLPSIAADSASAPQPITAETRQPATAEAEKPVPTTMEAAVDAPAETETKPRVEPQEVRVYADPGNVPEPALAAVNPPTLPAQPDAPVAAPSEAPEEQAPAILPDNAPKPADDESAMDVEPPNDQTGPVQPPDVIPDVPAVDQDDTHLALAEIPGSESERSASPESEIEIPYEHFEHLDFSETDGQVSVPPLSARDIIPLRPIDFERLRENVEAVLKENVEKALVHVSRPDRLAMGMVFLDAELPTETDRDALRALFNKDFREREVWIEKKVGLLEEEYLTLHENWIRYCAKLDQAAEVRRVKEAKAAAAAASNVVSEPVAAQTRSTRRNPVVNTGVMADAVHSDMEMEKLMSNMRDAAAVDPDLLARPNLAKIPDMITVTEPEHLRLTFDDENGQVDNPLEFYDFRGRAVERWTAEEKSIFIEQHRIHNKRFEKIAEHLPFKTTSQCVQYYYLMKKVPAFRAQVKRGQRRRLGRGGHQGKASALMADIEKEEDGTTASPREDESIATRRPRRHAAAAAATPPPSVGASETTKTRRPRVAELRGDSFTDRDGTATPGSGASDSEASGEPVNPNDLDALLSIQTGRKGGPGRGRRWAYKGETPNGNGGSVRLDGTEPPKKRPATTSYWTVNERAMLKQHLLHHGRDWNLIASKIQTKTATQAKNYYFNNQKELNVFVKAWEREKALHNAEDSSSDTQAEGGLTTVNSPAPAAKDTRKSGTPVTIQPAPGQSSGMTLNSGTVTPNKSSSGRGNSHYPNVIPQAQQAASNSQQPQWAKNTFPVTKSKTPANQPIIAPIPPLPLPGPTFRAWPIPPPATLAGAAPSVGFSYQTFPGVAAPSTTKGNGTSSSVQRTGSASTNTSATPSPNSNPAANVGRAATGVQRANVNHYPGPMRYQPYPIASGAKQSKQVSPQQMGAQYKATRPVSSVAATGGPALPKLPLPRNSSGQFASWAGDKGKKQA